MKKIICIGDSLTFGPGVRVNQKWTTLAARETGWQVVNLGVSGDTAAGMLARLRDCPREDGMVLILGGSNDIFYSGTDVSARSCVGAMVQQVAAMGMRPLVGIPLPVAAEDAPEKWRALADFETADRLLESYCKWLKTFCVAFGVETVDFREDFIDPDGTVRRELFLDGLHPNEQGHALMAKRLKEALV